MNALARLAAVVGCGLFPLAAAAADPPPRPNVIIIVADDMGWADLGCYGGRDVQTPHLDRLAAQGVRCTSGYVTHSFCSPTRAGLLTGRYQQRFGHENNPPFRPDDPQVGLAVAEKTLPELLRPAGYVSGAIGKWHLGAHPNFHPQRRGFDEFFGFLGGGHRYFLDTLAEQLAEVQARKQPNPEAISYCVPLERNGTPVEARGYLTDALSAEAAAFIDRHAQQPFLLYLAYNAPHTPLEAPPERLARFADVADADRRTFCAMMSAVDDGVGRVVEALDRNRLRERTLVCFLSDNGGQTEHGASNGPLRGRKGMTYEGGVRVPLLAVWPGTLPAGTYDRPVSSLDLLPTAVALAGATLPSDRTYDGVNLLPYLTGQRTDAPHETLYWRRDEQIGVRHGDWKLVRVGTRPAELYDLANDVGETRDVAAKHPETVARLTALYDAWRRDHIPPTFESPGRPRPATAR